MRKHIIGSREFERRKLKEFAEAGIEPILRREMMTEIKAAEGESRLLDFKISTASVDRYGDTVALDGWELKFFKQNPVVLWMHNNDMLPVGKASKVRVEDGALKASVEFTPEGLVKYNDIVFEMLKTGFLSATSVGFIPHKYAFVDQPDRAFGIDFLEQELLEFSIVTVPANADALIEGRGIEPAAVIPDTEVPAKAEFSLDLAQRRLAVARLRAA